MNNLYLITEFLYHNMRRNMGFEVEWGFIDDHKIAVQRKCKYVGLFPAERDS